MYLHARFNSINCIGTGRTLDGWLGLAWRCMVGWDWQDAGGLVTFMCVLFAVGAVYCVVVVAFVVVRPAAVTRSRR